jgi:hypothetical protein
MTTIEQSRQSIRDYAQREINLLHQQAQKNQEAIAAEEAAGRAYLEGDPDDHIALAIQLKTEASAIGMAIGACRLKRLESVRLHHDGLIADLRERSATERGQTGVIQSRVAPLLEKIKEIEGVDYTATGVSESMRHAATADYLEREAAEIERRGFDKHGHVHIDGEGISAEQIALAVAEVAADGPSATDVVAWVQTREHHERFPSSHISVRLTWADGNKISPQSYVKIMPPAPVPVAQPAEAGPRMLTPGAYLGDQPGRWPRPTEKEKTA